MPGDRSGPMLHDDAHRCTLAHVSFVRRNEGAAAHRPPTDVALTEGAGGAYARRGLHAPPGAASPGPSPEGLVRLTHRIAARIVGRRQPDAKVDPAHPAGPLGGPAPALPATGGPAPDAPQWLGVGGPGAAAAGGEADPCGPARGAAEDACTLADRMNALAVAAQDRLREARRGYDEHAGRRERAAATADPRTVRAAKDEAQAAFRRARLAAGERGALEVAAREWLREIDRVNARTRDAIRVMSREDAAEAELLRTVERLGVEADGARIASESAAEACRNARIALATCEERERSGVGLGALQAGHGGLEPASVVARATLVAPDAGAGGATPAAERGPTAAALDEGLAAPPPRDHSSGSAVLPAVLTLLEGDRDTLHRIAAVLAEGDDSSRRRWEQQLAALVEAVTARAIDGAALTFPEEHPLWGQYSREHCREIAAALGALGYRFDGYGGFADGRVPGQRELSLAIGYAGQDPMRIRIWPTEAEMARLFEDVRVDSGRFVAEAAGELTLGEMIDLLGRRAEDLSELWNAWGRVRPLLLASA